MLENAAVFRKKSIRLSEVQGHKRRKCVVEGDVSCIYKSASVSFKRLCEARANMHQSVYVKGMKTFAMSTKLCLSLLCKAVNSLASKHEQGRIMAKIDAGGWRINMRNQSRRSGLRSVRRFLPSFHDSHPFLGLRLQSAEKKIFSIIL